LKEIEDVQKLAVLCGSGNYMRRLCLRKRKQKLHDVENRMPEDLREGMSEDASACLAV